MREYGVRNLVFSSSATVYGEPKYLPLDELHPVGSCTNPYGKSKYFIEEMLKDLHQAEPVSKICLIIKLTLKGEVIYTYIYALCNTLVQYPCKYMLCNTWYNTCGNQTKTIFSHF